jgi:hypothetical protein
MGFSSFFGKKMKMRRLIGNYVKLRIKERSTFDQQVKCLEAQLGDNQIEKPTFERLREILETQYYQKQQKEWAKIENKFQNPFKS